MDVHAIDPGDSFPKKIQDELQSCDVLIALIGKNWEGRDASSRGSRLENTSDFVRAEITMALENNISVIPILVDGSNIPNKLPSPLSEIQRRHALAFYHQTFESDMENLFLALQKIGGLPQRRIMPSILLGLLLMFAAVYYVFNVTADKEPIWDGIWDYTFQGRVNGQTQIIKGQLILTLSSSNQINGNYTNDGGRRGSVNGTLIHDGTYIDGIWTSGSESGRFYFILRSDMNSFRGGYSANLNIPAEDNPNNFWNGVRRKD